MKNWWGKTKFIGRVIKAVIAILPAIVKLVKKFEKAGCGEEKKGAVLVALAVILKNLPWTIDQKTQRVTLKIAGLLIDIVIAILNLRGHGWHMRGNDGDN